MQIAWIPLWLCTSNEGKAERLLPSDVSRLAHDDCESVRMDVEQPELPA
jgi:hypothetical protein